MSDKLQGKITESFNTLQPLLLQGEQLCLTLEFLVAAGCAVGKTKPVRAYYIDLGRFLDYRSLRKQFMAHIPNCEPEPVDEHVHVSYPRYITLGTDMWPAENDYAGYLAYMKVFEFFAEENLFSYVSRRRYAELVQNGASTAEAGAVLLKDAISALESHVNGPDFEVPQCWMIRADKMEALYIQRDGIDQYLTKKNFDAMRRSFTGGYVLDMEGDEAANVKSTVWDPNPDAHTIVIRVTEDIVIPTNWGTYPIKRGGMIAIKEAELPALAAALLSIRQDKSGRPIEDVIEEALFITDPKTGKRVLRFDVYGMDAAKKEGDIGDCEKTCSIIPGKLKPETRSAREPFIFFASGHVAKLRHVSIVEELGKEHYLKHFCPAGRADETVLRDIHVN